KRPSASGSHATDGARNPAELRGGGAAHGCFRRLAAIGVLGVVRLGGLARGQVNGRARVHFRGQRRDLGPHRSTHSSVSRPWKNTGSRGRVGLAVAETAVFP